MRTLALFIHVLGLTAILSPGLAAQNIAADARVTRGKLVVGADQGSMHNIGAGGAARYRAHLAVATQVLNIVRRDAAVSAPVGYEMHIWRVAGPNDPPVQRYFPSYSGVYGVLLYYYSDNGRVEVEGEGPVFKVLVNDPSCLLDLAERIEDEQGPMGVAVPRGPDYKSFRSFGGSDGDADGHCIVLTNGLRPLTVPVSRERWLRALIRDLRARLDSVRADARSNSPEAWDSSAAVEYRKWLAEAPEREAQRKAMYYQILHPAVAGAGGSENRSEMVEKLRRQFKAADSAQLEGFRIAMSHSSNPELRAARQQVSAADSLSTHLVKALEAELAAMTPAERIAPAYIDLRSESTYSRLVDRAQPGAMAIVAPNPAYLDRSLPESAPQVITVVVDCRKVNGAGAGPGCGGDDPQRMNDYERILANLDWEALRALVKRAE